MHLGFLTPEYPHHLSTSSGGLGTSIKNMVVALVERRVKVTVFIYGQKQDKIFTEAGIHFHFIKHQHYNFFGWYLHRKFLQNYLNKTIKVEKIEAVEAPDWTGITAFMKLKCPLVIRMNGSDAYFCNRENRQQKNKNYLFEKTALKEADHLLSVSQFTAELTASIFNIKKEIKVIPNSVDTLYFRPGNKHVEPNTILYFGTIIRKKGVLELAEIFNIIIEEKPESRLIFAGKDVIDKLTGRSTKQLIEEMFTLAAKKNVEWLGVLPYEKVLDHVAIANIVVLPSFAEALPMTWIEAMSMEKALVTSDIGWAKEVMIDGETGFTVDPKDHQLYAEKILQLINDPALAENMGKTARKQVKIKFDSGIVVKQNISFYNKLLGVKN